MIHTNSPIIKYKAGQLNLAEELANVSRALPVLKHHGYDLTSLEMGVGLPPVITATFSLGGR